MTTYYKRDGSELPAGQVLNPGKHSCEYLYIVPCHRCGGQGGSNAWAHTGWTCFLCGGAGHRGKKRAKAYTIEKLEKLNVAAERRRIKKERAQLQLREKAERELAERRVAFHKENPGAYELIKETAERTDNRFLADITRSIEGFGNISEAQLSAALLTVQRIKESEDRREKSEHVGTVGERTELTLTIEKRIRLDAYHYYGPVSYINLCRDQDGNSVKYKGTASIGTEGDTVTLKATIKEHDVYREEKGTWITRPKVVDNA
jgi:hypothetical protein